VSRIQLLDSGALESDVRVFFDVQEIGRAQMRVAFFVAGVDTGRVDPNFHPCGGRVLFVGFNRARKLLEPAPHGRNHHMSNGDRISE
jgi:hypothetical protein